MTKEEYTLSFYTQDVCVEELVDRKHMFTDILMEISVGTDQQKSKAISDGYTEDQILKLILAHTYAILWLRADKNNEVHKRPQYEQMIIKYGLIDI